MFLQSAFQLDNEHVPSEASDGIRNKEWTRRRKRESGESQDGLAGEYGNPKKHLPRCVPKLSSRLFLC